MATKIIAVGKMKCAELKSLCAEYARRLSRYGGVEVDEIRDAGAEAEADAMLGKLANFRGRVYAMSEEGVLMGSREFSRALEADLQRGGSAFAIGGPYGLSDRVRARADVVMSMSPMTFTHEFARAVLLEQIYRAKTISANTGYQKAQIPSRGGRRNIAFRRPLRLRNRGPARVPRLLPVRGLRAAGIEGLGFGRNSGGRGRAL